MITPDHIILHHSWDGQGFNLLQNLPFPRRPIRGALQYSLPSLPNKPIGFSFQRFKVSIESCLVLINNLRFSILLLVLLPSMWWTTSFGFNGLFKDCSIICLCSYTYFLFMRMRTYPFFIRLRPFFQAFLLTVDPQALEQNLAVSAR